MIIYNTLNAKWSLQKLFWLITIIIALIWRSVDSIDQTTFFGEINYKTAFFHMSEFLYELSYLIHQVICWCIFTNCSHAYFTLLLKSEKPVTERNKRNKVFEAHLLTKETSSWFLLIGSLKMTYARSYACGSWIFIKWRFGSFLAACLTQIH